jgi:hypothetical protein
VDFVHHVIPVSPNETNIKIFGKVSIILRFPPVGIAYYFGVMTMDLMFNSILSDVLKRTIRNEAHSTSLLNYDKTWHPKVKCVK